MLSSLEIKNFKGIREGKISGLAQVNVLVGRNNSGKSTVLDALLLMRCAFATKDYLGQDGLEQVSERKISRKRDNRELAYLLTTQEPIAIRAGLSNMRGDISQEWTVGAGSFVKVGLMARPVIPGSFDPPTIPVDHANDTSQGKGLADQVGDENATFIGRVHLLDSRSIRVPALERLWERMILGQRRDLELSALINDIYKLNIDGFNLMPIGGADQRTWAEAFPEEPMRFGLHPSCSLVQSGSVMEVPPTRSIPGAGGGSPALGRWLVVVTAGLGMYLMALDISVNVALPTITDHFDTDIQTIQWIIVSFVATRAGLAVSAGSFGDQFGLKRVYLAGALIYGVAVTLIAFSPSLGLVFGLRVLQGVGAGSLYAVAPAVAGQVFTADRRGLAMGVMTASWALGSISGTVGMGFLVDVFGWEAAFLARTPFCLAALALGWMVLRDAEPAGDRPSFDVAGAVSLVGSMVSIVLALHLGGRTGWGSPLPVAFLVAFPVFLGAFFYAERRARWPVLDLSLLRLPPFLAACSSMFFVQMGAFVIWFVFPFYVADGLERGPLALGVIMAVMAASMSLSAPVAGWLSDRVHPRYVGAVGASIVIAGLLWMAQLDQGTSLPQVGVRIGIVGLGYGVFQAAVYSLLVKSLPSGRFGTGAGSMSLAQAMGSVVAVALGGFFFALRTDDHTAALAAGQVAGAAVVEVDALVLAFQDTFRVAAVTATLGIVALALSIGGVARWVPSLQGQARD